MSDHSWFFKSGWARTYFKRTPEGQMNFSCPSPGIFGPMRAYRLTDDQAETLVARIGRAYLHGVIVAGATLPIAILMITIFCAGNPTATWLAIAAVASLYPMACLAIVYRAAASVLAGKTWTIAPREPYSLAANLKKVSAIFMTFPLWLLGVFFGSSLISFVQAGISAAKALASGQVNFHLLGTFGFLYMSIMFGTAFVAKLRARKLA
jgi:hypothetical protein